MPKMKTPKSKVVPLDPENPVPKIRKENRTSFKKNDPRLIGNKNGVNGGGGRPRTVSPSDEEFVRLGEEMINWVVANKPTHLSEWYSIEKRILYKVWKNMCDMPVFSPYYEVALNLVAKNARNGTLDKSIAQRFLALYHRDLRAYDHEELEKVADLKKQETQALSEADVLRFNQMMELINKKQS